MALVLTRSAQQQKNQDLPLSRQQSESGLLAECRNAALTLAHKVNLLASQGYVLFYNVVQYSRDHDIKGAEYGQLSWRIQTA